MSTLTERMQSWEKGEYTYSKAERAILDLKEGQRLETIIDELKGCTICPVCNATCPEYFEIIVSGFHPEKPSKQHKIMICPLGATNMDECVLSK